MQYFNLGLFLPALSAVTLQQEKNAFKILEPHYNANDMSLVPNMVRYGFHSCFGLGCNGCLDMNNGGNDGLGENFELLNDLYDNQLEVPDGDVKMSRADFWALASWYNMRLTIDPDDMHLVESYKYVYGRKDCSKSPLPDYDPIDFPNASLGVDEIRRSFGPESIFGFTDDECVALIAGGHSLGEAHNLKNSDYEGVWDATKYKLDNQFVKVMTTYEWESRLTGRGQYQYYSDQLEKDARDTSLCLNTDMALYKEKTVVNAPTGEVNDECKIIKDFFMLEVLRFRTQFFFLGFTQGFLVYLKYFEENLGLGDF